MDLEETWKEWHPRARAYLRAFRALDDDERDAAATEAVLRACGPAYDSRRPFAPWFFAIVRRLALNALAERREQPMPPDFFSCRESRQERIEDELALEAEAAFARRFTAGLPQEDRELVSLVYGQELRVREAAGILGIPVGTAKWRLHVIRKAMRAAWEKEYA
jgi:RNA polymerase sigma-70 factor (ECF subfamily)